MRCTVSGDAPTNATDAPVPNSDKRADGQHVDHWVLCAEERAKGVVRPLRMGYVHVGPPGPKYPLRDLTDEERERWAGQDYVKYEPYPEGTHGSSLGRLWTQADLDKVGKGCGYYGSTFCCGCGTYLPVGKDGEFVWDGTEDRVGT